MENGYIFIGNNIFPSLFAISADEQERGLMFEPFPPPIMSFIYSQPKYNRFWMKNTPSPLDVLFCNGNEVLQICKGEPFSTQSFGDYLSDLVIELPYGTSKNSSIKLGDRVGIVKPTPKEFRTILTNKYPEFLKF